MRGKSRKHARNARTGERRLALELGIKNDRRGVLTDSGCLDAYRDAATSDVASMLQELALVLPHCDGGLPKCGECLRDIVDMGAGLLLLAYQRLEALDEVTAMQAQQQVEGEATG